MSAFIDFFSPRRLPFHIILAILLTLLFLFILGVWLNHYTHHGKEVKMPSYMGKSSAELLASGSQPFVFEVNGLPVFDESKPEGTVIAQDPRPGEMVKHGRKVKITITTAVAKMIKMPQLSGDISLRHAKHILEDSGLQLGTVVEVESDHQVGLVIGQYREATGLPIKAGTEIRQGEKIKLEVGVTPRTPTDNGEGGDLEEDVEVDPTEISL